MATTATATASSATTEPKDHADVRAAAMAVLKIAEERTEKGGTAAKHRSPLPVVDRRNSSSSRRSSGGGGGWGGRTSSVSDSPQQQRNSFNLFQWGKKQMDDMKESMNKFDEKFLAMQFEQEEKFRKAYDETTNRIFANVASPTTNKTGGTCSSSSATVEASAAPSQTTTTSTAEQASSPQPNEIQTAMSRFRNSFTGFTKKLVSPQAATTEQQRASSSSSSTPQQQSVDEQIVSELEQLHELMTLCHSLLQEKEELINLIDYDPDPRLPHTIKKLEAALPRMDQLMEAGIDGLLQEDTTQICVSTYERLILTLEKCNSPLVKSNAFAFTKDLEGDEEFDETTTVADVNTSTTSAASSSTTANVPPDTPEKSVDNKKEEPATAAVTDTTTTAITSPNLQLGLDELDADLDIDLAAFEIGDDDDDDEEDIILGDEKAEGGDEESPTSDDSFIKDMFE